MEYNGEKRVLMVDSIQRNILGKSRIYDRKLALRIAREWVLKGVR